MDLDKALVYSILKGGPRALQKAKDKGINPNELNGDGKLIYELILNFSSTYGGVLPSPDVVTGKTGIVLDEVQEPFDFFIDEVLNRNLNAKLKSGLSETFTLLHQNEGIKALEHLDQLTKEAKKIFAVQALVEPLPALGREVIAYYERIKAGETGILSPWPTLNEATLGFWPQDLALFVARVGIGKSWTAILLAQTAWVAGKKVLFATTEMAKLRIALRFFAVHFRLPYGLFRKGKLGLFAEESFKQGVEQILADQNLWIVGGQFDFRVESFEAAVEEVKPDIAVLDGAYLLRVQGANRIERAANAFDEIKRIAQRKSIPIIVTSQFNREVKANVASSVRTESIALTDVASWNADLIIGLIQTEDMKRDKKMIFKPLKVREGVGDDINVRWDIDNMDFTELPREGQGGGDADEFAAGVDPLGGGGGGGDVPF